MLNGVFDDDCGASVCSSVGMVCFVDGVLWHFEITLFCEMSFRY